MTDQTDNQIDDDLTAQDAQDQAPEPAKPVWAEEDVTEAKAFGWKAPDEWVGDKPAGYIDDPKAYLDRLNNMKPFRALRERLEKQAADFDERTRKLESMTAAQVKAQKDAYDRELENIRKQQRAAVELADTAQFDALEARKQALQSSMPVDAPVTPAAPQKDPYVAEYEAKNEWVRNPVLRDIGARLISEGGMAGKPVPDQIAYAEREIRRMYPAYFPADNKSGETRTMPQRVDSGGLGFAPKGGEFSKLPAEAKSAFARFAADGLFPNTEEGKRAYAEQYNAA